MPPALVVFREAGRSALGGRFEKLRRDYFVSLGWMFFSLFICTLCRRV